jgi:hypothetical protein
VTPKQQELWSGWRCRRCGTRADKNILCLRWRANRNGDSYCTLRTVRRGPTGLEYWRSFHADWKRVAGQARRPGWRVRAGFYCRKCLSYLGPTITELFQVFDGPLTTEEVLASMAEFPEGRV